MTTWTEATNCAHCGRDTTGERRFGVVHSKKPAVGVWVCSDCKNIGDDEISALHERGWQRRNKTIGGRATPVNGC